MKAALHEKGMSAGGLAEQAQLSPGRVETILRGKLVRLTLMDMSLIADALGRPLVKLLAPDDLSIATAALKKIEESGASDA